MPRSCGPWLSQRHARALLELVLQPTTTEPLAETPRPVEDVSPDSVPRFTMPPAWVQQKARTPVVGAFAGGMKPQPATTPLSLTPLAYDSVPSTGGSVKKPSPVKLCAEAILAAM